MSASMQIIQMAIEPITTALLIGGASSVIGGWFKKKAADKQKKHAEEKAKEAAKLAEIQKIKTQEAVESGQSSIQAGSTKAIQALLGYGGSAKSTLETGHAQSADLIDRHFTGAGQTLKAGTSDAMGQIRSGSDAAARLYGGATNQAMDQYGRLAGMGPIGVAQTAGVNRVSSMFNQGVGQSRAAQFYDQGFNLENDPGYQYRLEQGENAINRAFAAKGGRGGGRALMELQKHAQGLASQEYGAAYQRQSGAAQAADIGQLKFGQHRADLAGMADKLDFEQQLDYASRSDKADIIAQELQAKGLIKLGDAGMEKATYMSDATRSDSELLAKLGIDSAAQLADWEREKGIKLSDLMSTSSTNVANLLTGMGTSTANVHQNTGQSLAELGMAGAGQEVSLTGMTMPSFQAATPFVGASESIAGDMISDMGGQFAKYGVMDAMGSFDKGQSAEDIRKKLWLENAIKNGGL